MALTRLRRVTYRMLRRNRRPLMVALHVGFRLLPLSTGLTVVVYLRRLHRGLGEVFGQAYTPTVARALRANPARRISGLLTDHSPLATAAVLLRVGAYREAVRVLGRHSMVLRSDRAALLQALGQFELAELERMSETLALHDDSEIDSNVWLLQQKAFGRLLEGDEAGGAGYLSAVAARRPDAWCPHQNISARPPAKYVPNKIDLRGGADALLYDAYNYLGQRVTHVGRGDLGVDLYSRALAAQERLHRDPPPLSPSLSEWLARNDVDLATARILPWEWTTQIGHLGMLDVLFRMRALGWWSGKAVILPHRDRERIANHAFLGLFRALGGVVIAGPGLDPDIDDELFSLQRYYGLSFNAWKDPSGAVVPWQEAGAMVMRRWEDERRPLPLRDAFDARYLGLGLVAENVAAIRARWGMTADDWYACLHMRDPGFYGEAAGAGQTHRNASAASYLEAVRHVIDQGGWVIKLGGPHSLRLPAHPRIVDYARGKVKSGLMDLMLIRQARMFIGTTSGLTNVAISFGIPAALVNCITTDAQLWSGNVRFAPKPIVVDGGRILSQRELTSSPWRWRMFSAELLRREGALQRENSSDEILQTVSEVLELSASGDAQAGPDPGLLLDRWRAQLALPHFYGAARPSRYFLHKYRGEFLAE